MPGIRLLEAGGPLLPVEPNAIKTWREAERLSGAKSDPGAAAMIADYLRLRIHRLRPATPFSGTTKELRTLVRTRGGLVDAQVAASSQLVALLDAHWPGVKTIFGNIESAIALAFRTKCPTAASAASLTEKNLATFCARQSYSGKKPAPVLLTCLHSAPARTTDPALTDGVRDDVLAQVTVLTTLNTAIKNLDRSIIEKRDDRPDGESFRPLPHAAPINATRILARA